MNATKTVLFFGKNMLRDEIMEENKNNFTELKQNQTVDIVQAQILNEMRETKRHVTFLSKMAIAILVALIPGFIYFAYMLILMMI